MAYWGIILEELALNDDELKHLGLQKDVENKTEGKAEDEEWEAELARELQVFKTLFDGVKSLKSIMQLYTSFDRFDFSIKS